MLPLLLRCSPARGPCTRLLPLLLRCRRAQGPCTRLLSLLQCSQARCACTPLLLLHFQVQPTIRLAAGFDPKEPAMWVWEGVIMHLDDEALRRTLAVMRRLSAPGSS
ncbi:MAG: class I SAM-dependent methyltransferase [Minicystis sp.]